jgi:UDP:flavonoid glycosyltransferase YjiC (YdhE family)
LKVVISSFGSSGDFNPCLGIARALHHKGADVIFLSNPYYEKIICSAGLRFFPAGEYLDIFKVIADEPKFLHPQKGPLLVWKMVLETIPVMYSAMMNLIQQEKPDIAAFHILEFGGTLAALQNGIPYATLNPTPMGWFSISQPGNINYFKMPLWFRRCQMRVVRFMIQRAHNFYLKPYCRKHQIPNPIHKIEDSFGKACINLGLWSPILRPTASDDPPHSKICGFVRDEHIKAWPDVPDQLATMFEGPKRPVVVGLGSTASLHGDQIYQNVATACRHLNWPCLLIGAGTAAYAEPQHEIMAADFAPYGWVFPRSAVVIHHGGVNTTAETLLAGVPGLIIPHAYDQFDNASRTERMGVSRRMKVSQIGSGNFPSMLENMLYDTEMATRAHSLSKRLQVEPEGAMSGAEVIFETLRQS